MIEERPQAARPERRIEAKVGESLKEVGKALVPQLSRIRCYPQDPTRAALEPGGQGRLFPALAREHLGGSRDVEHGQLQRLIHTI